MIKAIGQNVVLFGGMAIGAVITAALAPMMLSPTGALGPSVLQAYSAPRGVAAILGALIVATVLAVVVGRICNTVVGMFAMGGALFGLSWRMGTIADLRFDGSLGWLAIETLLLAALVLVATIIVFRLAGPLDDIGEDDYGRSAHSFRSMDALKSVATGVLVLPIVFVIAQSPLKGQTLGAVFCGATGVGLVARLIAPNVQPILVFAAPLVFGAIGHLISAAALSTTLDAAFLADEVPHLSTPMPIDYAAASLMGVAVGLGWAKSFLHHEDAA